MGQVQFLEECVDYQSADQYQDASRRLTKETTVLGVSSLALRDNTERLSTITIGTRKFVGAEQGKLSPVLARLMAGRWEKCAIPLK